MSAPSIVGFSGNIARPSKTKAFVDHVAQRAADRLAGRAQTFDIEDLGPSFPAARWASHLDAQARDILDAIVSADLLIVGSPTYKGSYTGLFKHFFDLVDPRSLRGKPVILLGTGGGERHALMVEHQLRPLFGFFEADTLATAVYASDADFAEGRLVSDAILQRAELAVEDALRNLGRAVQQTRFAAE